MFGHSDGNWLLEVMIPNVFLVCYLGGSNLYLYTTRVDSRGGFPIGFFITFTKLTVDGLNTNMVLTANFPYP